MNAAAGIGHNGGPPLDDDFSARKPRLTKERRKRLAYEALLAARLLALLMPIPKKRILSTRQGEKGFTLRCLLSSYMVGRRQCPKKYFATLIEAGRDVPGDDEKRVEQWCAESASANGKVERVYHILDLAMDLDLAGIVGFLIALDNGEEPIDEAIDDEEEIEEGDEPEEEEKKAAPWNPVFDSKPDIATILRREEAARVQRRLQEQSDAAAKKRAIAICEKIIKAGTKKGANEEAKKYVKPARLALEEIHGAGIVERGRAPNASKKEKTKARQAEKALTELVGLRV